MVCKTWGNTSFLGLSWVLTTYNICPPRNSHRIYCLSRRRLPLSRLQCSHATTAWLSARYASRFESNSSTGMYVVVVCRLVVAVAVAVVASYLV